MTVTIGTKYFQGWELTCKCGCGLLNYDNEFLMKLEVFRSLLGGRLKVTSGCRCKQHNTDVKGVENSNHIAEGRACTACDVVPLDNTLSETFAKACSSGFFNEVIYYVNDGFIHLGCDSNKLKEFYQIKT